MKLRKYQLLPGLVLLNFKSSSIEFDLFFFLIFFSYVVFESYCLDIFLYRLEIINFQEPSAILTQLFLRWGARLFFRQLKLYMYIVQYTWYVVCWWVGWWGACGGWRTMYVSSTYGVCILGTFFLETELLYESLCL